MENRIDNKEIENMDEKVKLQKEFIDKVRKINEGKNLKYHILTMGCQLNESDSEKLSGMLEEMGYSLTKNIEEANLIVFNTCCVRENAEDKLFGKLGEVKRIREANNGLIAIGGCMMQEKHIVEKLKKSYPFFDIAFGTHTLYKFPEDIYTALMENKQIEDILDIDGEVTEGLPVKRDDNIKASVLIMNGCNNFCTYCIVPYVRGRERSRKAEDILKEVEDLAKQGYKEITLLGQNVNSYMRSERENGINKGAIDSFAKLLRAVNEIGGIERIRFVSPHPKDFTDDVIDAIKDCKKVCKIIHLPLQSGSTNILKSMNRKYTKEQYIELAEKIKSRIPEVVFSTDIIVGFPGETEEDFEDTLDVVRKVNFEQVYMFIYSRRVGTPADKMENQVPEEVKHERFDRLKKLAEENIKINNQKYVGTTQKVLVEGFSKTNSSVLTGRTDTNKVVNFEGSKDLSGKVISLRIVSEHMWYLKGEI